MIVIVAIVLFILAEKISGHTTVKIWCNRFLWKIYLTEFGEKILLSLYIANHSNRY